MARSLVVTSAACFHPLFWEQPFSFCDLICDYCEDDEYVLVTFVIKVSINFRVQIAISKLALDAFKELEVFNSL